MGLCTGFCATASRWPESLVNALMSYGSKQMQGAVLTVLISLPEFFWTDVGIKVLWQPYHQCAEETQLGRWAASITQTRVQACVWQSGICWDVWTQNMYSKANTYTQENVMHKCRDTSLLWVPSATEGMSGVYGMIHLSGTGCVVAHLIHDARRGYLRTAEAEEITLKEIFLIIAIV